MQSTKKKEMNPLLKIVKDTNHWTLRLPQTFNGIVWMLSVTRIDNMVCIKVFDTTPTSKNPLHITAHIGLIEIEALCVSAITHHRLTCHVSAEPKKQLIVIANHTDNIVSQDSLLIIVKSAIHSPIQLCMHKSWFK